MNHKEAKGHIRAFMQAHYTDERLAQLLAHAQEGKLRFASCCCFIGIVTADHALRSTLLDVQENHYDAAFRLPAAEMAESAFRMLWRSSTDCTEVSHRSERDAVRGRILIPMVRAEMRRRDHGVIAERAAAGSAQEIAAALISKHMVAR